ncbi:MAG: UDP-N-acetylmuramate--L-alanine ligase [Eubacteriales bacterium]|nr:UDP-N-acetylmuramate--L-alanine ligase [Eubacteriales bacterium]
MKINKFFNNLNIFFVGIGGISMSGLAKISLENGARVSGSDISTNDEITRLQAQGVVVFGNHSAKNITSDINLVVYSGAISTSNPELVRAKELNIKTMERSKFLGQISRCYNHVIAISGTHGKTTTTAMIAEIFANAGKNPTIHLGGESVNLHQNTVIGGNDYIILEACEYRESFLQLNPECGVITNIESDHLDYYKNYKNIIKAFGKFAKNSSILVTNEHIEHKKLVDVKKTFAPKNICVKNHGYLFDVYKNNSFYEKFELNIIGRHNIDNAIFAIAVADLYGISKDIIHSSIASFRGCKRRYELIGDIWQTPIIIDYAHHPTEISNSIRGVSEHYKSILVVFQPHTYSRTKTLLDDFAKALASIDNLIIFKTYPARENEIIGGRAWDLFEVLKNPNLAYIDDIKKLYGVIHDACYMKMYDCVLILGAGDLATNFCKLLQN